MKKSIFFLYVMLYCRCSNMLCCRCKEIIFFFIYILCYRYEEIFFFLLAELRRSPTRLII